MRPPFCILQLELQRYGAIPHLHESSTPGHCTWYPSLSGFPSPFSLVHYIWRVTFGPITNLSHITYFLYKVWGHKPETLVLQTSECKQFIIHSVSVPGACTAPNPFFFQWPASSESDSTYNSSAINSLYIYKCRRIIME